MWSPHFRLGAPATLLFLRTTKAHPTTECISARCREHILVIYHIDFQKESIMVVQQQLFAFVPTDGPTGIGSAERQLIRRHCMRQRNKQPNSRRSKREAARTAAGTFQVVSLPGVLAETERMQPFCVPSAPPSDWALFPFPEALDVPSQKLMHECR
jgi:hypothetical protein